jgi:hypothetical protein
MSFAPWRIAQLLPPRSRVRMAYDFRDITGTKPTVPLPTALVAFRREMLVEFSESTLSTSFLAKPSEDILLLPATVLQLALLSNR